MARNSIKCNMAELDCLVAQSLENIIEENLSNETLRRIKQRLNERHGLNLRQSIENFSILDSVLREFFGGGAEGLERQFIKSVISLEKSIEKEKEWVTVEDKGLSSRILKSLGDNDKSSILDSVTTQAKTVSEIVDACKISQNVAYMKISSLIEDGLLASDNGSSGMDDIKSKKFKSLFENMQVTFNKNEISIKVQISDERLRNSAIIQVIREKR